MSIENLKPSQIADNIKRYRERGVATGGPFSLAQLLQEQNRRAKPGVFGTVETAQKIIELSQQSSDGLISYGDLWTAFRPDEKWSVFKSRTAVTKALEQVGYYCVRHKLPLIITLVVNASQNELTDQAKDNIYNAWTERGLVTASERDTFIDEQQQLSKKLVAANLPPES